MGLVVGEETPEELSRPALVSRHGLHLCATILTAD